MIFCSEVIVECLCDCIIFVVIKRIGFFFGCLIVYFCRFVLFYYWCMVVDFE